MTTKTKVAAILIGEYLSARPTHKAAELARLDVLMRTLQGAALGDELDALFEEFQLGPRRRGGPGGW